MKKLTLYCVFLFAPFFLSSAQTGDCDMGTQYCEGNSLTTTNTTTTTNTNTNNSYTNTDNHAKTNTNINTNINY